MTSVSFLTTVYNGSQHLERCLASSQSQTIGDIEIVVVDDGSDDESLEIAQSMGSDDSRIKVVRAGRVGRQRALNIGLRLSTSDLVAIVDADDYSQPERAAIQRDRFNSDPALIVLSSGFKVEWSDGTLTTVSGPSDDADIRQALRTHLPLCHSSVMFRRDVAIACGGYPDVHTLEDYLLWLRMARWGKFGSHPDALVTRTRHQSNYRFAGTLRARSTMLRRNLQAQAALDFDARDLVGSPLHIVYPALPERIQRWLRNAAHGEEGRSS